LETILLPRNFFVSQKMLTPTFQARNPTVFDSFRRNTGLQGLSFLNLLLLFLFHFVYYYRLIINILYLRFSAIFASFLFFCKRFTEFF